MKAEALYVSPEGIIKVITEMPVKPLFSAWELISPTAAYIQNAINTYNEALSKAKEEAIEVQSQEQATSILVNYFVEGVIKRDTIYAISGYDFRIEEACGHDSCPVDAGCECCKEPIKLAILTPSSLNNSSEEEQEEIWDEVGVIVYRSQSFKFYEHVIKELKSKFTIQRKTK